MIDQEVGDAIGLLVKLCEREAAGIVLNGQGVWPTGNGGSE
jgi:hypothetical protein